MLPEYTPSEIARFWAKVDRSGECWLWISRRNAAGYGKTTHGCGVYLYTHRIAWLLTYGPIPAGLCVLHRCDNPPCCNPAHLFLGTLGDNNRDSFAKGRGVAPTTKASGASHGLRTKPERFARSPQGRFTRRAASEE